MYIMYNQDTSRFRVIRKLHIVLTQELCPYSKFQCHKINVKK